MPAKKWDPQNPGLPSDFGKIQEIYQSPVPGKTVILIQDAHAVPDAQRNIQKIIDYFSREYGVNLVGVEGSASRFDAQIFRSFPDRARLQKVFNEYLENGELTGVMASAIFNSQPVLYQGIENWELYEAGLAPYLAAAERQPEILRKLSKLEERLNHQKKKIYSSKLLEIDQAYRDFSSGRSSLLELLKTLAAVYPPASGTELAALSEEARRSEKESAAIEREVKTIAEHLSLEQAKPDRSNPEFNEKYQAFKTSRIPAVEFATWIHEKYPDISFSPELASRAHHEMRIRNIEGTRLFQDFELYFSAVKEKAFKNNAERWLDKKSRRLEFLNRLARLQLSREDWQNLKRQMSSRTSEAIPSSFESHLKFYQNAEQRERALFDNLILAMDRRHAQIAMTVAGGFHAEGLTRKLKEKNISYLLVTPQIANLPEEAEAHYQQQMKGEVSWKNSFKAEGGRIRFYNAFVRGTRDRLLALSSSGSTGGSGDFRFRGNDPLLLKGWRDQIIRDLAEQGHIEDAGDYTHFLDEVTQSSFKDQAMKRVENFLAGLKRLETRNEITGANLLKFIHSTRPADAVAALGIGDSVSIENPVFSKLLAGTHFQSDQKPESAIPSISARSEMRFVRPFSAEERAAVHEAIQHLADQYEDQRDFINQFLAQESMPDAQFFIWATLIWYLVRVDHKDVIMPAEGVDPLIRYAFEMLNSNHNSQSLLGAVGIGYLGRNALARIDSSMYKEIAGRIQEKEKKDIFYKRHYQFSLEQIQSQRSTEWLPSTLGRKTMVSGLVNHRKDSSFEIDNVLKLGAYRVILLPEILEQFNSEKPVSSELYETLVLTRFGAVADLPKLFSYARLATKKMVLSYELRYLGPAAEAVIPQILQLLTSSNAFARINVVQALRRALVPSSEVLTALKKTLKDPDASVRRAAVEALEELEAYQKEKEAFEKEEAAKKAAPKATPLEFKGQKFGKLKKRAYEQGWNKQAEDKDPEIVQAKKALGKRLKGAANAVDQAKKAEDEVEAEHHALLEQLLELYPRYEYKERERMQQAEIKSGRLTAADKDYIENRHREQLDAVYRMNEVKPLWEKEKREIRDNSPLWMQVRQFAENAEYRRIILDPLQEQEMQRLMKGLKRFGFAVRWVRAEAEYEKVKKLLGHPRQEEESATPEEIEAKLKEIVKQRLKIDAARKNKERAGAAKAKVEADIAEFDRINRIANFRFEVGEFDDQAPQRFAGVFEQPFVPENLTKEEIDDIQSALIDTEDNVGNLAVELQKNLDENLIPAARALVYLAVALTPKAKPSKETAALIEHAKKIMPKSIAEDSPEILYKKLTYLELWLTHALPRPAILELNSLDAPKIFAGFLKYKDTINLRIPFRRKAETRQYSKTFITQASGSHWSYPQASISLPDIARPDQIKFSSVASVGSSDNLELIVKKSGIRLSANRAGARPVEYDEEFPVLELGLDEKWEPYAIVTEAFWNHPDVKTLFEKLRKDVFPVRLIPETEAEKMMNLTPIARFRRPELQRGIPDRDVNEILDDLQKINGYADRDRGQWIHVLTDKSGYGVGDTYSVLMSSESKVPDSARRILSNYSYDTGHETLFARIRILRSSLKTENLDDLKFLIKYLPEIFAALKKAGNEMPLSSIGLRLNKISVYADFARGRDGQRQLTGIYVYPQNERDLFYNFNVTLTRSDILRRSDMRIYSEILKWPVFWSTIKPLSSAWDTVARKFSRAAIIGSASGGWMRSKMILNWLGGYMRVLEKSLSRVMIILASLFARRASSASEEPVSIRLESWPSAARVFKILTGTSSSIRNFISINGIFQKEGILDFWQKQPRSEAPREYVPASGPDNNLFPQFLPVSNHSRAVQAPNKQEYVSRESRASRVELANPPKYIPELFYPLKASTDAKVSISSGERQERLRSEMRFVRPFSVEERAAIREAIAELAGRYPDQREMIESFLKEEKMPDAQFFIWASLLWCLFRQKDKGLEVSEKGIKPLMRYANDLLHSKHQSQNILGVYGVSYLGYEVLKSIDEEMLNSILHRIENINKEDFRTLMVRGKHFDVEEFKNPKPILWPPESIIIREIVSNNAGNRIDVVTWLGSFSTAPAGVMLLPGLLNLLKTVKDPQIQRDLERAIGATRWSAVAAFPIISKQISPVYSEAWEAALYLGPAAEVLIPEILKALDKATELEVKIYACEILGRILVPSQPVLGALKRAQNDSHENVRLSATRALEELEEYKKEKEAYEAEEAAKKIADTKLIPLKFEGEFADLKKRAYQAGWSGKDPEVLERDGKLKVDLDAVDARFRLVDKEMKEAEEAYGALRFNLPDLFPQNANEDFERMLSSGKLTDADRMFLRKQWGEREKILSERNNIEKNWEMHNQSRKNKPLDWIKIDQFIHDYRTVMLGTEQKDELERKRLMADKKDGGEGLGQPFEKGRGWLVLQMKYERLQELLKKLAKASAPADVVAEKLEELDTRRGRMEAAKLALRKIEAEKKQVEARRTDLDKITRVAAFRMQLGKLSEQEQQRLAGVFEEKTAAPAKVTGDDLKKVRGDLITIQDKENGQREIAARLLDDLAKERPIAPAVHALIAFENKLDTLEKDPKKISKETNDRIILAKRILRNAETDSADILRKKLIFFESWVAIAPVEPEVLELDSFDAARGLEEILKYKKDIKLKLHPKAFDVQTTQETTRLVQRGPIPLTDGGEGISVAMISRENDQLVFESKMTSDPRDPYWITSYVMLSSEKITIGHDTAFHNLRGVSILELGLDEKREPYAVIDDSSSLEQIRKESFLLPLRFLSKVEAQEIQNLTPIVRFRRPVPAIPDADLEKVLKDLQEVADFQAYETHNDSTGPVNPFHQVYLEEEHYTYEGRSGSRWGPLNKYTRQMPPGSISQIFRKYGAKKMGIDRSVLESSEAREDLKFVFKHLPAIFEAFKKGFAISIAGIPSYIGLRLTRSFFGARFENKSFDWFHMFVLEPNVNGPPHYKIVLNKDDILHPRSELRNAGLQPDSAPRLDHQAKSEMRALEPLPPLFSIMGHNMGLWLALDIYQGFLNRRLLTHPDDKDVIQQAQSYISYLMSPDSENNSKLRLELIPEVELYARVGVIVYLMRSLFGEDMDGMPVVVDDFRPDFISYSEALMESPHLERRRLGIMGLGYLGPGIFYDSRGREILEKLKRGKDPETLQERTFSYEQIQGRSYFSIIRTWLRDRLRQWERLDEERYNTSMASDFDVHALRIIEAVPTLLKLRQRPSQSQRVEADLVLSKLKAGAIGALPNWINLLNHPLFEEQRFKGVRLLGSIGPPAVSAVPGLLKMLQQDPRMNNVIFVLGEIGEATPAVLETLKSAQRESNRRFVREALDKLQSRSELREAGRQPDSGPGLGPQARSEMRGHYVEIEPAPELLDAKPWPADPFEIKERTVHSYDYVVPSSWLSQVESRKHYHIASYQTGPRPDKLSLSEEDQIRYVENLLRFADLTARLRGSARESFASVVIHDEQDSIFKRLLKKLAREYASGLSANGVHAYREVDPASEKGKKIITLATYLNHAYGAVTGGEPLSKFPQTLIVDQNGFLFVPQFGKREGRLFDLGEGLVNLVEKRLIDPSRIRFRPVSYSHFPDSLHRLLFVRLTSDYEKEDLLIQDAKKARAARLVWALWTGNADLNAYNTHDIEGIPIDFDLEFKAGDLDRLLLMLEESLLTYPTEERKLYTQLDNYDLAFIGETIQKIIEKDLAGIPGIRQFPGASYEEIRTGAIPGYLLEKKRNQGEWLWQATAAALNRLTGSSLDIAALKQFSLAARSEFREDGRRSDSQPGLNHRAKSEMREALRVEKIKKLADAVIENRKLGAAEANEMAGYVRSELRQNGFESFAQAFRSAALEKIDAGAGKMDPKAIVAVRNLIHYWSGLLKTEDTAEQSFSVGLYLQDQDTPLTVEAFMKALFSEAVPNGLKRIIATGPNTKAVGPFQDSIKKSKLILTTVRNPNWLSDSGILVPVLRKNSAAMAMNRQVVNIGVETQGTELETWNPVLETGESASQVVLAMMLLRKAGNLKNIPRAKVPEFLKQLSNKIFPGLKQGEILKWQIEDDPKTGNYHLSMNINRADFAQYLLQLASQAQLTSELAQSA